jgi:hypothetical protein
MMPVSAPDNIGIIATGMEALKMPFVVRRVIIIARKPQQPQGCGCLVVIAVGVTLLASAAVAFACF